jgi:hypothetical protein
MNLVAWRALISAGARRVCVASGPSVLGDSIYLGAGGLLLGVAIDVATGLDLSKRQDLLLGVAALWVPGLQVLAMLNLFFVARDAARSRWRQALAGFALSVAAGAEPLLVPAIRG